MEVGKPEIIQVGICGSVPTSRLGKIDRGHSRITLVLYRKWTARQFRLAWPQEFAFDTAVRRKPLAVAADAGCYGNSIDFCLKSLARRGLCQKVVVDAHRCRTSRNHLRHLTSGTIRSSRGQFRRLCLCTRQRPPRERLRSDGQTGSNSERTDEHWPPENLL